MRAVCWQGHGSLGFESDFTLVCDTNGDTFGNSVPVVSGSSVSCFVEVHDDWNLGAIPLSRNADVRASLHVVFTPTHMRCREPCLTVPDKTSNMFRLVLQSLDAL